MNSSHYDYIIIGQGLAGSAVAIQLLRQGKKIVVIDQPEKNYSSRIAAGLFNPVTGQNMVKTWLADEIFPYLFEYYQSLENQLGRKFFYPMPLYRPFTTIEHQNDWMSRTADSDYQPYIDRIFDKPSVPPVMDPFGGIIMKQCGFLDTLEYIRGVRILIQQKGTLVEDEFRGEEVKIHENFVQYRNLHASKLIFCHGAHQNTWFGWLPIRSSKGETITIQTGFNEKMIINRGVYLIPTGTPGEWRAGATYNFHDQSMQTTAKGLTELKTKVQELISVPFSIKNQVWGIRPTTHDRRPVLGSHPEFRRLIVFNGLGTKGISLAPYFSSVLVHWLENKGSIKKEVDIERYKSVYWSSPEKFRILPGGKQVSDG